MTLHQSPPWPLSGRRSFGASSLHNARLEYSDSNEDVALSLDVLDVRHGQVVIGVTGSADLVLLSLRHDPAFVAAYDVNPAQNALGELKRAAIANLSHSDYLGLFGYRRNQGREEVLHALLTHLEPDVQAFWQRDDMVEAVRNGLWRSGSASRRDFDQWDTTLRQLESRIGPTNFAIALGVEGDREQREALRDKLARTDARYAEPAYRNNNHFKFNVFRYRDGIANEPAAARYAASFLPEDAVAPPWTAADHDAMRARVHRISFQTYRIHDAFREIPPLSFDRAYLSNVTEYLSLAEEQEIAELLIQKAKPDAVIVFLFLALTPAQQRDLLDHSTWSERGLARFVQASRWRERIEQKIAAFPNERSRLARVAQAFESLSKGGGANVARAVRDRIGALDTETISKTASESIQSAARRIRAYDYLDASERAAKSARAVWNQTVERWKEVRQLDQHDLVLIENRARTAALCADIYANLRATHASKSFYGFDYAILRKVARNGATYSLPSPA